MDPRETVRNIISLLDDLHKDNETDTRPMLIAEALADLLEWFDKGGFVPNTCSLIAARNRYAARSFDAEYLNQ